MKARTHEEFLDLLRERIAQKQYDVLFSAGCCFHFALRSFRHGVGSLAYLHASLDPAKKGHVFVITPEGLAFDRKGFRTLAAITKEFGEWGNEPHFAATEAEIEGDTAARRLPPDLEKEVYAIADEIIAGLLRHRSTPPSPN